MRQNPQPRTWTTGEVANLLGVDSVRVKNWTAQEFIKPVEQETGTGRAKTFEFREVLRALVMHILATYRIQLKTGADIGHFVATSFSPEWLEPNAAPVWLTLSSGDLPSGWKLHRSKDNAVAELFGSEAAHGGFALHLTPIVKGVTMLRFSDDGQAIRP